MKYELKDYELDWVLAGLRLLDEQLLKERVLYGGASSAAVGIACERKKPTGATVNSLCEELNTHQRSEDPVKPYDNYYQNAVTAANRLIIERDGDLEEPAQEFDFNVRHNVSTENLHLCVGDFLLWDSDEDEGADDVEVIMKIAKERLASLAESFKRWL